MGFVRSYGERFQLRIMFVGRSLVCHSRELEDKTSSTEYKAVEFKELQRI